MKMMPSSKTLEAGTKKFSYLVEKKFPFDILNVWLFKTTRLKNLLQLLKN